MPELIARLVIALMLTLTAALSTSRPAPPAFVSSIEAETMHDAHPVWGLSIVNHAEQTGTPSPKATPKASPPPVPTTKPRPKPKPVGSAPTPKPVRVPPTYPALRTPGVGSSLAGSASWYCSASSACTRGYPSSGYYAAAGPRVRAMLGNWRGQLIQVCAGRCITVRLIDWCGCPNGRLVDLYRSAFSAIGSPSKGVLRVTVRKG